MTDGLTQAAMAVFADATRSDTHFVKDDTPRLLAGFRNYKWGDAAARRLGTFGGNTFDIPFSASEGNRMKRVNPGGTRTLSRTDNIDSMSQRVVLKYADMALVDDEIDKNQGISALMEAGNWDAFYDRVYSVLKHKEGERAVTLANDMERMMAAVANFTLMEDRTLPAEEPYSYFALVNEWLWGLFGINTTTGLTAGSAGTDYNTAAIAAGGRWATKQGVTMNQSKYLIGTRHVLAPTQETYTTLDNAITSFNNAMLRCIRHSTFKNPPQIPETMASGIEYEGNTNAVWYMSSKGLDYIQYVVNTQQQWVAPNRKDPAVMDPLIGGVPAEWWEQLDSYAGYPGATNTTLVTEGASTGDRRGPRAYLHRRDTLFPVAHRLRWFKKRKAPGSTYIPDLIGEYLDVEHTWASWDLRQQGVVSPSATPSGLPSSY